MPRADNAPWEAQHHLYVEDAQRARRSGGSFDLLFYGDSILEAWRGTGLGQPEPMFEGVPAVFAKFYGRHNAYVFAQAGQDLRRTCTASRRWCSMTLCVLTCKT